jgi:hypothetical protein
VAELIAAAKAFMLLAGALAEVDGHGARSAQPINAMSKAPMAMSSVIIGALLAPPRDLMA